MHMSIRVIIVEVLSEYCDRDNLVKLSYFVELSY